MEAPTASPALDATLMAAIERAEVGAWIDMYRAAPADYMEAFKPEILDLDGLVLTRCAAIPFVHFNNVLNLGIERPATGDQLDAIGRWYAEAGIDRYTILHNPSASPAELPGMLEARGFTARGAWERIYRPASAPPIPAADAHGTVELVDGDTAGEWAAFLVSVYGMPVGPWLLSFAVRVGWTHAMLRREGRVVAVRSMFTNPDGWAWLGVEAPVPGLMGPTYADDLALDAALVRHGLGNGATDFVADIEAPSPDRDTPAYANWAGLGFGCVYARKQYVCG
jgi:hypothetical protein